MDETLSYKTKPVIARKGEKEEEGETEWMDNSSVWISFALIKALVDEVIWDNLNQDTHTHTRTHMLCSEMKKGAERVRWREEGDKETERERETVMSY